MNKVKLLGKEKPYISEYMSESTRIGIAVAIGLVVVFLVTATCTYMVRADVLVKSVHYKTS